MSLVMPRSDIYGSFKDRNFPHWPQQKKMAACRFYRDPLRAKISFFKILGTRGLTRQHTFWWIKFILASFDCLKY